jgi:signal transduction histidine kinase
MTGTTYADQLDMIVRNATRLKEIVDNLSNVDNVRTGAARIRNQQVSMAKIVEDVLLTFQDEANARNITLTSDLGESPFYLDADEVKLGIALSNLVKNALQYTESGGHVTVKVQEEAGHFKVSVTDDGIGIPAKDLPRVFERFFQVETHLTRRYSGMGLGLAVAKAMIELHNGRIWVESEDGKGSTFTFLIPTERPQTFAPSSNPFVE